MFEIFAYPALDGDFLRIHFGKDNKNMHNVIIDGGRSDTAKKVKKVVEDIFNEGEKIDAIFLSHIDNDHIMGLLQGLKLFSTDDEKKDLVDRIDRIFLNSHRGMKIFVEEKHEAYGASEQIQLMELLICELGMKNKVIETVQMGDIISIGDAKLYVLSPGEDQMEDFVKKYEKEKIVIGMMKTGDSIYAGKDDGRSRDLEWWMKERIPEDDSEYNGCSIAFILEYDEKKAAFLADAFPSTIIDGLSACNLQIPYPVNCIKIAHHGSSRNTTQELLNALPTTNYIISTKKVSSRPHKYVFSQMIKDGKEADVYMNYDWWLKDINTAFFTNNDYKKYVDITDYSNRESRLRLHFIGDTSYEVK